MNRGRFYEKKTLKLFKMWRKGLRKHDDMLHLSWLTSPLKKFILLGNFRKKRLSVKNKLITNEILRRYKATITEKFKESRIKTKNFEPLMRDIWDRVQYQIRFIDHYMKSQGVIWDSYAKATGSRTKQLKPKFMLRCLVDEMPNTKERRLILELAYSGQASLGNLDASMLNDLNNSYIVLHKEVSKHINNIEMLTDGAIKDNEIKSMVKPYVAYDLWLFPNY